MKTRIDWVRRNCRLLAAIGEEFASTQPFAGKTIGTGIHLEPKTVALLLTLQRGGARIVSTGNLNTTQLAAVAVLEENGVTCLAVRPRTCMNSARTSKRCWASGRTCCSTTAATFSTFGENTRIRAFSVERRRRRPVAYGSSPCAANSRYRFWSSTTAR